MNRQTKLTTLLRRAGRVAFGRIIKVLRRHKVFNPFVIIFLLTFLFIFSCTPKPPVFSGEEPVEPLVAGKETLNGNLLMRGRFSVLNPEMKVFALSISRSGKDILFSSEARTINRLDDEGTLLWEINSEGLPVCAALSEDGRYAAVGTDAGKLYYIRDDGFILWEKSFNGKVEHLALNKDGEKLILSVEEEGGYSFYFSNQWGFTLWKVETGPLQELFFTARDEIFFLEAGETAGTLKAVREGEIFWEKEAVLTAFSDEGDYMALFNGDELQFYRLGGDGEPALLWSALPGGGKEISWIGLTGKGRHLLAYDAFAVGNNNLWAYGQEGVILWERKIPSGALLGFSSSGERIVASSWQEYSEDFSKVEVYDNLGEILQEVELASRIEKIALSGDGSILALAGSDGNLFILDIPARKGPASLNGNPEEGEHLKTIYQPVVFEKPVGETFLTLFFFDEGAHTLIPVNRNVKEGTQTLQAAVNELVKGPRRLSGLSRTVSKEVFIEAMLEEDIAYVNLPAELNRLSGSTQLLGLIDSIVLTLSQFSSVRGIQFLVEGEKTSVFGGEGIFIDRVFPSRRPGKAPLLYLPYRSGERYFLFPRETALSTPEELAEAVLKESYAFLPVKPQLREIRVLPEEIVLDWEASFEELFAPEAGAEERLLIKLFTDALLLTLGENLPPDRLVFLVEGEPWNPPEGCTFSGEISRPFFINPE